MIDEALIAELDGADLPRSGSQAAERAAAAFFATWRMTCSCSPIDLREDERGALRCNGCDSLLLRRRREAACGSSRS